MASGMAVGHLAGDLWWVGGGHQRTPWSPCTWLMGSATCCHINMEIPCHSQISGHPGAHYHRLLAIVSMATVTDSWLSLEKWLADCLMYQDRMHGPIDQSGTVRVIANTLWQDTQNQAWSRFSKQINKTSHREARKKYPFSDFETLGMSKSFTIDAMVKSPSTVVSRMHGFLSEKLKEQQ